MSRHHMLPPIVYTPAPPKPKTTERRRGIGYSEASGEAAEDGEISNTTAARSAAVLPQHSRPVEASERHLHSTTGKLSEDTLKAMLEMQEQEAAQAADSAAPISKD